MIKAVEDCRRHYGLDWLRIAAFSILILYHIGLYFGPWGWHVEPLHTERWLVFPLLVTAPWRMSLLFVVSGYASAMMLSRSAPGSFLRERSWRLLLPLGFAMLVINPPQGWVEARIAGDAVPYLHWWLVDQLHLAPNGRETPSFSHMWFVAYVWLYAVALAGWRFMPHGVRMAIHAGAIRVLEGKGMLIVPLGWLLLIEAGFWPGQLPGNTPASDGFGHVLYLSAFAFGALLAGAPSLWAPIRQLRWIAVAAAVVGYAAIIWSDQFDAAAIIGAGRAKLATDIGYALMIWGTVIALLAFADLYLNHDHRWRAPLTQAVFPFYIIHQTIIVLMGYWLRPLDLSILIAFPLILAATTAGCMLFWQFGSRIAALRPLIGLPANRVPAFG